MAEVTAFDKYANWGAYHWVECDRRYLNWKRYNPAVDARYEITVRAIVGLRVDDRLIDIGCGDGLLMARVAPFMRRVVGVDSEETAVHLAREKLGQFQNCEVVHASSYKLPVSAGSFDIAVSADVIEHLKDPTLHMREVSRVLKRTGALVLTTPKWRQDRKWDTRHEKEYTAHELGMLLAEYFDDVAMTFFWPIHISRLYATKLGWRLLKIVSIAFGNPFDRTGSDPEKFGQILAICRKPRSKL